MILFVDRNLGVLFLESPIPAVVPEVLPIPEFERGMVYIGPEFYPVWVENGMLIISGEPMNIRAIKKNDEVEILTAMIGLS